MSPADNAGSSAMLIKALFKAGIRLGIITLILSVVMLFISEFFSQYVIGFYFYFFASIICLIDVLGLAAIFYFLGRFMLSFMTDGSPTSVSESGRIDPRNRWMVTFLIISGFSAVIILFSSMYRLTGLGGDCAENTSGNYILPMFDDLYFAIITLTTVGYGDCHPVNGGGRFVASFEAITGYLILGLLVSSLSGIFRNTQKGKKG